MAEEDDGSKTEDPSGRKLAKGREDGNVAQSQEIRNWMILLGAALGIVILAKPMSHDLSRVILPYLSQTEAIPTDFEHLRVTMANLWMGVGVILAPLLLLFLSIGVFGNVAQTGLLYAPKKIEPNWEKISPLAGLKRLFSTKALVEFVKGIVKLGLVSVVAFGMIIPLVSDYQFMFSYEMGQLLDRIYALVLRLTIGSVAVMTAIAALDYAYQRFSFMQDMRMSKHEVKEETRQTEGDPQIKARIRRIRMDRARRRMMAAVPRADVIITNPTHYAIALEYKMKAMDAPRLIAKGIDEVAFRIRQVAEAHEIPIVENPPLARALYATVELDQEIPPEHYKAVAEVIGYVMRLRGQLPAAGAKPAAAAEQTIRM